MIVRVLLIVVVTVTVIAIVSSARGAQRGDGGRQRPRRRPGA